MLNRLMERVHVPVNKNECWEWKLQRNARGYGVMWYGGKRHYAHRISYEAFNGAFNKELKICHRCDNPSCVNPAHLFSGSQADNMRDCYQKGRMVHAQGALNKNKTHCPSGHEYSGTNLRVTHGRRQCRECAKLRMRRLRE